MLFGIGLGGDYMIIPLMAADLFGRPCSGGVMGIVLDGRRRGGSAAPMLVAAIRDSSGSYAAGFLRPASALRPCGAGASHSFRRPGAAVDLSFASCPAPRTASSVPTPWARSPTTSCSNLQFRELDLQIEGTELALRIEQIYSELAARNLSFRPHFWLSDEWFTPDGIPGVAIPFYLAHPRLAKLELSQMLEVEGGDAEWCLRILRHEAGHAIDNAFNLRRRKRRRELFGSSRKPYPESYTPKPYSKNFVLHLDSWYRRATPTKTSRRPSRCG